MPGLVFICRPGIAPRVYAARRRPAGVEETLYHAPLFNVFADGRTCAGTNQYPATLAEIPESFMVSFFTVAGSHGGRSKRHPESLRAVWEEMDGKARYPVSDLVEYGTVQQVMEGAKTWP